MMKKANRIVVSLVCLIVCATVGQAAPPLALIHINPNSATMQVGDQQQFQAWGDDGSGGTLMLTDPQWSIDGGATLTPILHTCIVKADQPGTYTLKCRQGGTTIEGTATITINTNLTTIEVSPANVAMTVGQTQQFGAAGKDQYGNTTTISNPVWTTTGGGTLNASGSTCSYTATSAGSYTITCTQNGTTIKGTATITVTAPPQLTAIEVSPANVAMTVGQTQQFGATGKDQNGDTANVTNPVWTTTGGGTLNPSGSTCSYTATSAGSYTIACTEGGTTIKGTATITVNDPPHLVSIEVSPPAVTMNVGQTQQFGATGKDQNGDTATIASPQWWEDGINTAGPKPPSLAGMRLRWTHVDMKVGETLEFDVHGWDADGNDAAVRNPTWTTTGGAITPNGALCTYTATQPGDYTITCRDENGVSATATIHVQNQTTTHTFTATRAGHFNLTCQDVASGIARTAGISVKAARGDISELLVTTGSPPPLTGHTLVSLKGSLYLFGDPTHSGFVRPGGLAALGSVLSSTWRLDGVEGRWEEEETSNSPPARHGHSAIAYNGKMYIFFGQDEAGYFLNDLWEYDSDTGSWVERTMDPALPGLSGATVFWTEQWTVAGGTRQENGIEVSNNDIWDVNPNSLESSYITQVPAEAGAGIPLGSMYSPAGWQIWVLSETFDQVYTYDKASAEWGFCDINEPRPAPGWENVQVTRFGGNALITGTRTNDDQQTVESWVLSLTDAYWSRLTGLPEGLLAHAGASSIAGTIGPSAQMAGTAAGPSYQILFFGGQRTDGSLSDETIIYTPPYEQAVASIAVTPESTQIHIGETVRFVARGYDAEDFPTSLEPVWSATGAMIDPFGFFTATEEGDFAVIASEASTGIEGIAFVTVTAPQDEN